MSIEIRGLPPAGSQAGSQVVKIYQKDKLIPQAYFDLFKRLETLPLRERIEEIDRLYWAYVKENNIQVGPKMIDVQDPYLHELAFYRECCCALFF